MSATEANRYFSRLLRIVRGGQRVRVTAHGETVALIVPPDAEAETRARDERLKAARTLQRRWVGQAIVVGDWSRDDLYERDDAGRGA